MSRARLLLTAAAVTATVSLSLSAAACGGGGRPVAGAAYSAAGSVGGTASAAARAGSSAAGPAAPPLVGVNLYLNQDYPLADVRAWGQRDLKYIARTLRLKAVSIAWDYNVPSRTSDRVTASAARTPTIADLAALTAIARSYGLRVEYRALYAIGGSDSRSGSIQPKHLTAWLRSLLAAETPALTLAQRDHVGEFVAGTEMAAIDQSPLWGEFFTKAARLYGGTLSYAQWGGKDGGGFFSAKGIPLPGRAYGASAYPPVNLPATASVARLARAWVAFLRQEPARVLRLTAIDEIGIPAVAGAYRAPYQWDGLGHPRPDWAVQANWYRAACQAADQVHLRAIYFWSASLSSNPASAQSSLVGFEDHPATEAAIRSCP